MTSRIARIGSAIAFVTATIGCAAPGDRAPREGPGERPGALVLIVIDTLRGDRLGHSGWAPAVTPTLDSLAATGLRFTQVSSPVPVTLPAVTSLLTGRYPFAHGVRDNGFFALDPSAETIARRFRAAGFRTGAVIGSAVLQRDRGLAGGFEIYDDEFAGTYPVYDERLLPQAEELARTRRRADDVTDRALRLLDGWGDSPFFLLVHYFDVHMELDPPPEFARLHPGRPYDGEVTFVDHEVGRLLAGLRSRPDALVVVTADHGESQGDHGEPQHGFLVYQSTLAVPWIAAGPGVPSGAVRDDPVSLVDLEPTLARAFDLPPARESRSGRALDWAHSEPQDVPLYSETMRSLVSYGWSELRALRLGDWKLISGPTDELYNLRDDPNELVDLGDHEMARQLGARLAEMTFGDDPETVRTRARQGDRPQSAELLESLGYVAGDGGAAGATETARGVPGEPPGGTPARPHPKDALPQWLDTQLTKELVRSATADLAAGRWEAGIARLDSAIARTPDHGRAYALRGLAQERVGRDSSAAADFRRALALDPGNLGVLVSMARFEESRGRAEEARKHWAEVALIDPDLVEAAIFLAGWHLERGDDLGALPYLRRIVARTPDDVVARYNLGIAAREVGRSEEAIENLERFLELAPDDPSADEVRSWLRELGASPSR